MDDVCKVSIYAGTGKLQVTTRDGFDPAYTVERMASSGRTA